MQKRGGEDCLVLEDGLFTGVELSDLLRSLCGIKDYNKCPPLSDRTKLEKNKTIIRFALGTDIGAWRVRETIATLQINMAIEVAHEVKVLTEAGLSSLHAGTLYCLDEQGKEVLTSADKHIISHAFLDQHWGADVEEAKAFCRKIGLALWQSYQMQKGKNWSEKRLSDCALGAGNMGLLFSFAHSLPKSTLPIFWCHGTVPDQHGRPHKWKPLFPSAHRN